MNILISKYHISNATIKNWERLNTSPNGRLISRANKQCSNRHVEPLEYIDNIKNIDSIRSIVEYIISHNISIQSAIFSLGVNLLKENKLFHKKHVLSVVNEYSCNPIDKYLEAVCLPTDEPDILGFIYQSILTEGIKNSLGSYYTPQKIVNSMVKDFSFLNKETFLDPCCGSGIFLLSINAPDPNQLFGIDIDPIAVMIAKFNLLIHYPNFKFTPQIYNLDFLASQKPISGKTFDYIVTNPPWGAKIKKVNKESFSLFFIKAFNFLSTKGIIKFLFPESVLNVKHHADIRKFLLENGLSKISLYDDTFSGVASKYISIECSPTNKKEYFTVSKNNSQAIIPIDTLYETKNFIFNFLSQKDLLIIEKVRRKGKYSLKNSTWGLGIVTGDNKRKLFTEYSSGMEKIYTGKEIEPYKLKEAKKYIYYNRDQFQQVAKDEIYRAPEKLVYKFISKKLVFAYDCSASLFLNSANILIPSIPGMSIKTVMAFLNSMLFQYLYLKLFGELKVLRGNLLELLFPEISIKEDKAITKLVNNVISGKSSKMQDIDNLIFSIYKLNEKQIQYIKDTVNKL